MHPRAPPPNPTGFDVNLKDAMSCFATGVTVVTTHAQGQDWGLTCSSFNTVSLDPALVLWSIRRPSFSHAAFVGSGAYLVNVLAANQQDVALQFASGSPAERFAAWPVTRAVLDLPLLPGVLAWFACKTVRIVEAGDHEILLGEVVDVGMQAGHGLAYAQRRFGVLSAFEP